MTTWLPDSPKICVLHAWRGRPPRPPPRVMATMTPLPRARPSALTTVGMGAVVEIGQRGWSMSSKTSYSAVGMWYFFMRSLEKTLLPSMNGGSLAWGRSRGCRRLPARSTAPRTRGSSGATTAKSMALSLAKAVMRVQIFRPDAGCRWRRRRCRRCRGRRKFQSPRGLFFRLLMMACSRPPPPTTRIFMETDLLA